MKKLPLKLRGNVLKKNNLIVGDRKFYKVSFDSIDEKYNFQMLSKLEAMGSNVHEIVFSNCRVSEPKVIHDILRNFPNIVSLIFKRCEFIEPYQKSNIEAIQFYYLEDLVLFDSCLMVSYNLNLILKCILILSL